MIKLVYSKPKIEIDGSVLEDINREMRAIRHKIETQTFSSLDMSRLKQLECERSQFIDPPAKKETGAPNPRRPHKPRQNPRNGMGILEL